MTAANLEPGEAPHSLWESPSHLLPCGHPNSAKACPRGLVGTCGGSHHLGLGLHALQLTHLLSLVVPIPKGADPRVREARGDRSRDQGHLPTLCPGVCQPAATYWLPMVPTHQAAEGPPNLPSVATRLGHRPPGKQFWHKACSVGLVFINWCLGSPRQ